MIKAIIVDDERLARAELHRMLDESIELDLHEASSYDEAIKMIDEIQPHLVFMDIQLSGKKTGFDVLEQLDYAPYVIFCTAYDEYAIKAFEHNALDYLMKPIDPSRLTDALNKFKARWAEKKKDMKNNVLSEDDQVFVKDGERCWFVNLGDVRLFESAGNYAKVFFGDQKPLILKSLNALEERLDEKVFFRANRKHIINLKWIHKMETYVNGGLLIYLKGGEEIEVSRRQAVKFKDMMSL